MVHNIQTEDIEGHRMNKLLKRLMRSGSHLMAASLTESDVWENSILLQGTQAALAVRGLAPIRGEFNVFSQFGEDGIIEWLVSPTVRWMAR